MKLNVLQDSMDFSAPDDGGRVNRIAVVGLRGFLHDYTTTQFRMPRIGPVIIASILRAEGYQVRLYAEAVRRFSKDDLDYIVSSDVVAISVLTYGANAFEALCSLIRRINPRARIIVGDVHATIMPERCLAHADFVIRGEGDETIVELLAHLDGRPGALALSDIQGLSYRQDGLIYHNEDRERPKNINIEADLSMIEHYLVPDSLTLLTEGRANMAVIQASRGCPVACKFCLGSAILGTKYRTRDIEHIIAQLHKIRRHSFGERRIVFIIDNHLFINLKWTRALLRRIIEEKFNFGFIAFGQYMIGRHPDVLDLLREAGFIRIFVGFESINPETLKEYRKKQGEDAMRACIAAMHEHGIHIHGSFMLGGETDDAETAERTINFAIETKLATASFFGLCEYPFEDHPYIPKTNMLPRNRLIPDNLSYYNLNFVSIFPKLMKPSTLQRYLIEAHRRFYSPRQAARLWREGNRFQAYHRLAGIWGDRKMVRQMEEYIPYLQQREEGIYDSQERLLEDRLPEGPRDFINPIPNYYDEVYNRHQKQRRSIFSGFTPSRLIDRIRPASVA